VHAARQAEGGLGFLFEEEMAVVNVVPRPSARAASTMSEPPGRSRSRPPGWGWTILQAGVRSTRRLGEVSVK